jgi:hypothetical protein
MKKIAFIFILSFLVSGCYIPFPSIGKSDNQYMRRIDKRRPTTNIRSIQHRTPRLNSPTVVHCRKYMTEYGTVIERCFRHKL